jgi:putative restriction endonuclease
MDRDEVFSLFDKINVWKRGDERAPHKPLLILYALGKISRGEDRYIPFAEVDQKLKELLTEFGPSRKSVRPEYPFWRLQNDGVWELSPVSEEFRNKVDSGDAPRSELLNNQICGGFSTPIYTALKQNPRLLNEVAESLLEKSFPTSIHEDILLAVGLDLRETVHRRRRDPAFQSRVFVAYEYRCAICGFDIRLNNISIGIEAAHIKWHQAGGPDTEDNGLALCVLHHKLFDRGAFTLSDDYRILASQLINGSQGLQEWLLAFHNKLLRMPQSDIYKPNSRYIDWHRKQVFQGLVRSSTTLPIYPS